MISEDLVGIPSLGMKRQLYQTYDTYSFSLQFIYAFYSAPQFYQPMEGCPSWVNLPAPGIEPTTLGLNVQCSYQLSKLGRLHFTIIFFFSSNTIFTFFLSSFDHGFIFKFMLQLLFRIFGRQTPVIEKGQQTFILIPQTFTKLFRRPYLFHISHC